MSASETPSLVRALQSALLGRSDVRVALLFGSLGRGSGHPDSDVDIAVVAPGVDWLSLAADLATKLGREVDIAPLDTASIPLLEEVLRDGIVVHEARPGAAAFFRSHALAMLEIDRPWFARMRDAWLKRVAERGIGWVNRDRVASKIADLSERVSRVKVHCPASPAELVSNRDALDLVSFNLMLAVQACADIASHLIADEGWPAAQSLADGFQRLHERSVISAASATALSRAVGLRNVVAHGYSGIDATIVHTAATRGVTELDTFAREIAAWLASRTSPAD